MHRLIVFATIILFTSCHGSNQTQEAIEANNRAIAFSTSNPDSAIHYFDKAIAADSTYLLAYQNKVNFFISIEDYQQALETAQILSNRLENSEITKMIALLHDITGNSEEATTNYLKTIDLIDKEVKRVNDFVKYQKLYSKGTIHLLLNETKEGIQLIKQYSEKANIPSSRKDSILRFTTNRDSLLQIFLLP